MLKSACYFLKSQRKHPLMIIGLLLVLLVLILISMRVWAAVVLKHTTNDGAITSVAIVTPVHCTTNHEIILPGTVSAWHEAPIYARSSGYVKNWYVDIGDEVQAGQILAEISSPEVDAQLRQADADLNVVRAQNTLAQLTAKRWMDLVKSDFVSKQHTDEKIDEARALAAAVMSAIANRDRLQNLVSYERVIAPFAGTISSRQTDLGALINAGQNLSNNPLFRIVQSNPLRIYVQIPETYSASITPNMKVQLRFAEHPRYLFTATLMQTAKAFNPKTRTLLAQFKLENKKGMILPGGYTEVIFTRKLNNQVLCLPINTLLFRAEGLQVARLNSDNIVILQNVSVSKDFGTQVEINRGIKITDRIIMNPADSITAGEHLRVKKLMPSTRTT